MNLTGMKTLQSTIKQYGKQICENVDIPVSYFHAQQEISDKHWIVWKEATISEERLEMLKFFHAIGEILYLPKSGNLPNL